MIEKNQVLDFIKPKIKFASTSLVATLVDYTLYLSLVYSGFPSVKSNVVSASTGFIVNFFLQKKFIFQLRRKAYHTFLISLSFSLLGIAVSSGLIYLLVKSPFFEQYQYVTKLLVTGVMFFYNYYTKQWAFERKVRGPKGSIR